MTIENVIALIGAVSTMLSIAAVIVAFRRNGRNDAAKTASDNTAIMLKLEFINTGIADIKSEIATVKTDERLLRDELITVKNSVKSAHKRMDDAGIGRARKDDE